MTQASTTCCTFNRYSLLIGAISAGLIVTVRGLMAQAFGVESAKSIHHLE